MEKPVIYIDVLFATNCIINYILLMGVGHLTVMPIKIKRTLLSSMTGGLYAACMFFPGISFLYGILGKLGVSALMIYIAFPFKGLRAFFRQAGSLYVLSFAFCGGVTALYYLTPLSAVGFTVSNGVPYFNISAVRLIVYISICYILVGTVFTVFNAKYKEKSNYYKTEIWVGGRFITVNALLDTGNHLKDSITGRPAIIAELEAIRSIMDDDTYNYFLKNGKGYTDWKSRIRLLPYSSIGNAGGSILAFRADNVVVVKGEKREEYGDIFVGVYSERLSVDGAYSSLLHSSMNRL